MTQQEFETLYGKTVAEKEFEIINAMYMLDENETKQDFVARYKKMGKDELMSAFIAVTARSNRHTEAVTARAMEAEREVKKIAERDAAVLKERDQKIADLEQELHDFLQMSAVYLHSYQTDVLTEAIREKMGTLNYYKELLAAGCTPTKTDLEAFVKALEESK